MTGELAGLADKTAAEAAAVLRNGRRAVKRRSAGGSAAGWCGRWARWRSPSSAPPPSWPRPGPGWPGGSRLARPGWSACTTPTPGRSARAASTARSSSAQKAQVTDNDDGIVLDYSVEYGAAPDGPQLAPAIQRIHRRAGQVPRAVAADRGYGQAATEADLQALGVRTVAIPRQATTSAARKAIEHSRGFRKLVKWRTGCEGRISYLKRCYGWDRTRLDGRQGAATWCGHAVFTHNLVKIAALASCVNVGRKLTPFQRLKSDPLLARDWLRLVAVVGRGGRGNAAEVAVLKAVAVSLQAGCGSAGVSESVRL